MSDKYEDIGPICGDGPPFCVVCTALGELCSYTDGRLLSAEDEAKIRHVPVADVVAARASPDCMASAMAGGEYLNAP